MMISSDGGETWGEAKLPTLTGDRVGHLPYVDLKKKIIENNVTNHSCISEQSCMKKST